MRKKEKSKKEEPYIISKHEEIDGKQLKTDVEYDKEIMLDNLEYKFKLNDRVRIYAYPKKERFYLYFTGIVNQVDAEGKITELEMTQMFSSFLPIFSVSDEEFPKMVDGFRKDIWEHTTNSLPQDIGIAFPISSFNHAFVAKLNLFPFAQKVFEDSQKVKFERVEEKFNEYSHDKFGLAIISVMPFKEYTNITIG